MSSPNIRLGTFEDYSLLVQWCFDEFEWELSPSDYLIYTSYLPPDWFWVAENQKKEVIGFISVVEHGQNDGYIGLFFVRKDQRGAGVGKVLFDMAMKKLEGRNSALTAENHLMQIYTKKNFTVLPDYTMVTAEGYTIQAVLDKNYDIPGIVLEEPDQSTMDLVIRYDSSISGRNRSPWCTRHLLHNRYAKSLIAFDTTKNSVCGYGSAKDIGMGKLKVGPLYADSEGIAKLITSGLLAKFMGQPQDYKLCMFCMLPNKEKPMNAVAAELGLETPYPMNHMFTKYPPPIDKSKIFCLADCDVNLV